MSKRPNPTFWPELCYAAFSTQKAAIHAQNFFSIFPQAVSEETKLEEVFSFLAVRLPPVAAMCGGLPTARKLTFGILGRCVGFVFFGFFVCCWRWGGGLERRRTAPLTPALSPPDWIRVPLESSPGGRGGKKTAARRRIRGRCIPLSHSPTLPLSHSPTLPLSHSPTLPLSHLPNLHFEMFILQFAISSPPPPLFLTGCRPDHPIGSYSRDSSVSLQPLFHSHRHFGGTTHERYRTS
ncbi:hypothetical protein K227x_51760 [Rubripirellula lacrimiformis]|uniref:Uncharacterized protein n=1 Tax=Rubripirellula lacrimiformis TaxID=1930273 RepID=A0A517NHZ7_9BACT|nr:hypothetical protein K227x_51760 [Rubripirellula lacrimiformis]